MKGVSVWLLHKPDRNCHSTRLRIYWTSPVHPGAWSRFWANLQRYGRLWAIRGMQFRLDMWRQHQTRLQRQRRMQQPRLCRCLQTWIAISLCNGCQYKRVIRLEIWIFSMAFVLFCLEPTLRRLNYEMKLPSQGRNCSTQKNNNEMRTVLHNQALANDTCQHKCRWLEVKRKRSFSALDPNRKTLSNVRCLLLIALRWESSAKDVHALQDECRDHVGTEEMKFRTEHQHALQRESDVVNMTAQHLGVVCGRRVQSACNKKQGWKTHSPTHFVKTTALRQKLHRGELADDRLTHEATTVIHEKDFEIHTTVEMHGVLKHKDLEVQQLRKELHMVKHKAVLDLEQEKADMEKLLQLIRSSWNQSI